MADTLYEVRKGMWAFFLTDCAFRVLIGWEYKLLSHEDSYSFCSTVLL